MKYTVFCWLTLLAGHTQLHAIELEEAQLDPIVITGTKTSKSMSSSPIAVEVITSEQIAQRQATTLADVIESVPSLMLSRIHGQDGSELVMQGMSGNHILILKNGIPIHQEGATGVNLDRIQLGDIQRIEIVPGNASVLYGSSAMGGVINIITGDDLGNWLSLTAQLRQNEIDHYHPSQMYYALDHGIRFGKWHLASQWDITQRQPYDIPDVDGSEDISELNSWHGNESLTYQHSQNTTSNVWLSHTEEDHDRHYQQQLGSLYFPYRTTREYRQSELGYRLESKTWELALLTQKSRSISDQDNLNTSYAEQHRDTKSSYQNLNLSKTFYLENHDISAGYTQTQTSLEQDKLERSNSGSDRIQEVKDATNTSHELFIQDDWYATDNLELVTGVRTQWNNDYGSQTVPNISVRWDANDGFYLRSSVGLGYREPNLKERYYQFDHSTYGYEVIGNPDLKPELAKSFSVELGNQHASITGFYKQLSNLIDTKLDNSVNNGLDTYVYSNIDHAIVYGAEISGSTKLGQLALDASYQWTQTEDKDTGLELDRRPEHQASLKLSYPLTQSSRLSLTGRYTGEQFYSAEDNQISPDYITLDSSLTLQLTQKWGLALSGRNLLNTHTDPDIESDLRPQTGRQWLATLTYSPY